MRFRAARQWRLLRPLPLGLQFMTLVGAKEAPVSMGKGDTDDNKALRLHDFPNFHFITPQLPPIRGLICGSSRGWICLVNELPAPNISLLNSFTQVRIQLPRLPKLPICTTFSVHTRKVILSSDPISSPNDCNSRKRLMFLLPGSKGWTTSRRFPKGVDFFHDILFYKGSFYAVSHLRLFICHHRGKAKITEITSAGPPLPYERIAESSRLVESAGELLLVTTTESPNMGSPITYAYVVYQADLSGGLLKLLKLANIGGRSLFLNYNSMTISVTMQSKSNLLDPIPH